MSPILDCHDLVMADAVRRAERFPLVWAAADRDAYSAEMVAFAETESPNRLSRHGRRVAERCPSRSIDKQHKDVLTPLAI